MISPKNVQEGYDVARIGTAKPHDADTVGNTGGRHGSGSTGGRRRKRK